MQHFLGSALKNTKVLSKLEKKNNLELFTWVKN